MTLPSRPPRVHRGSPLPPGVPPPKRGELHLRVEGFDWQNMAFEARPPACCSLVISWWGQASYNSLLMPLSASLAFSPATAIFSVHSGTKRFESYLQDMGFLELTLVNGHTTFDLKDVSRTMLGKLSVSVSSLAEGHPVRGSYPIFANGHRLIGSLTLGITVTFYNRTADEAGGQCRVESNSCRRSPRREIAKSLMVSSFERIEELASKKNTLPLYPLTPVVCPGQQPMRRDVNVISYSSSNSEQSSGSSLLNEEAKLVERSLNGRKGSPFDQTVRKIVNKRLPRTKSSLSSESEVTLSTVSDVNSSPLQRDTETNDAHIRPANPYLDPSYCELDGLEAEKADSLCGSDESSLSCVISKSARLMKSLASESARHASVKSANLSCNETALKDSNRLSDLSRKGCHSTINSKLEIDQDLSTRTRKNILKVERLDNYASVDEIFARDNTDMHEIYGKQSSDSNTSERIRNLRAISALDTLEGFEERNPQSSLRLPQLCTDEAHRGGLSDLLLPSTSGVSRSTCYTNNLFEDPANPTGQNVWRRDEELVADDLMPKGVSFTERNNSDQVRPVSLGSQPPLIPKVDFGFDPGGNRNSSLPSRFALAQTKATNLAVQLNGDRAAPADSSHLNGENCFSVPYSGQPNVSTVEIEPVNRIFRSPCPSPQTVIDDIKQLIKRAEACRDTLKKPEYPKTMLMVSSAMPSAESIHLSRSHSGHSLGLNSSSDDLLANILAANDKGRDGELPTKVHRVSEDLDLAEDIDDATDVMTAALLEALYVDNDKNANVSSAMNAQHQGAETGGFEGYWHDDYLQSPYNRLKNPKYWHEEDRFNSTERFVSLSKFDDHIPEEEVFVLGAKHDQPFNLRVTIGKLVLCGPMVRDLADCRPSKEPLMHPTCTCSLTVSFPALIPPYSSKQRICVSPISFGTRDAVFDHQSQLSWNTLPGLELQDWQSRDLRVAVLLTWQRFDTMECAGYISLEKVVTSMPGVYRTSLPLALTSHLAHKRSRSRSPSKGRSPKKSGKQTTKSGLKHLADASKRNRSENSERLASIQKDAVARVDVMLQLFHGSSVPENKQEPFQETHHARTKGPSRIIERKPLAPGLLTNSAPVLGSFQDWWLQVIVHDVVNCFENVLSSPVYSPNMKVRAPHLVLVVKSGPEQIVQVPFPQKLSLRNEIPGNITGGVLRAPEQLLISRKAVIFIEVWHDAGMANITDSTQKPPGLLVGLIKAPLKLATGIVSPAHQLTVSTKRPEVVAEGLYQLFDPLQCTAIGTLMVTVTLGSRQQMHRLWNENKAATLIQRRVREFLTRDLGPDKSIEITRFWDANKNPMVA